MCVSVCVPEACRGDNVAVPSFFQIRSVPSHGYDPHHAFSLFIVRSEQVSVSPSSHFNIILSCRLRSLSFRFPTKISYTFSILNACYMPHHSDHGLIDFRFVGADKAARLLAPSEGWKEAGGYFCSVDDFKRKPLKTSDRSSWLNELGAALSLPLIPCSL